MPGYNYEELANQLGITGRKSGQQLVGQCPLHQDTKPSFSLNIQSGLWTCFARCGAGNFSGLVHRIQGGTIAEAHDWMLQAQALMPVRNPSIPEPAPDTIDLRWMHKFQSISRSVLPQWWFDRGFTWDTANKWDIRYDEDAVQLIIPFYDRSPPGNWVDNLLRGTITRNLKTGPKYQNSPGLPRSKYLYGLTHRSGDIIYLTEGPLDCLAFADEGLPSAAILGVKLSDDHIKLLLGFSEICLALDNDEAGHQARDEITQRLFDSGRLSSQVTEFIYPASAKDPGECIGYLASFAQHRRPIH